MEWINHKIVVLWSGYGMTLSTHDGVKVYTPVSLKLYDWWVLNISNRYAWRCDTDKYLISHFRNHLGNHHMDIGVGTGFYLKKSIRSIKKIALTDLNFHSLEYAQKHILDDKLTYRLQHDIFHEFPHELNASFDSISLFYLLHCLPGTMDDKKKAIENMSKILTENGILYGATILGKGVEHNTFGNKLMSIYNKKGIFCNYSDSADSLEKILSSLFYDISISVQGTVALFTAKNKKHKE